jgi:CheY-like chemotaxis protein
MDGAALAEAIHAEPLLQDTVAILLTPVGHWSAVRQMQGSGIEACLVKPVRESQLRNTLAAAWAKKLRGGLAEPAGAPPEPVAPKPIRENGVEGAPVRLLVAEDNPVNLKVALAMLDRLGLRPDAAANGLEAVERSALLPYDLIFMDCQMPEMDGYTAAAEIRKRQGPQGRVVIVAMTADVMEGCRERCLAAGMDDYISKPVRVNDLIAALQKWAPQAVPAAKGQ